MPYWPLSRRQLPRTCWRAPAISPRPALFWMVLASITQPSPESWLTTPSFAGGAEPWTVRSRMVDVRRLPGERVAVHAPAVEYRARCADVGVAVLRDHLAELSSPS